MYTPTLGGMFRHVIQHALWFESRIVFPRLVSPLLPPKQCVIRVPIFWQRRTCCCCCCCQKSASHFPVFFCRDRAVACYSYDLLRVGDLQPNRFGFSTQIAQQTDLDHLVYGWQIYIYFDFAVKNQSKTSVKNKIGSPSFTSAPLRQRAQMGHASSHGQRAGKSNIAASQAGTRRGQPSSRINKPMSPDTLKLTNLCSEPFGCIAEINRSYPQDGFRTTKNTFRQRTKKTPSNRGRELGLYIGQP